MNSVIDATVSNASSANVGSAQGVASLAVMKTALNLQEAGAAQLIAAVPQVPLATSGTMGTKVNTFA